MNEENEIKMKEEDLQKAKEDTIKLLELAKEVGKILSKYELKTDTEQLHHTNRVKIIIESDKFSTMEIIDYVKTGLPIGMKIVEERTLDWKGRLE